MAIGAAGRNRPPDRRAGRGNRNLVPRSLRGIGVRRHADHDCRSLALGAAAEHRSAERNAGRGNPRDATARCPVNRDHRAENGAPPIHRRLAAEGENSLPRSRRTLRDRAAGRHEDSQVRKKARFRGLCRGNRVELGGPRRATGFFQSGPHRGHSFEEAVPSAHRCSSPGVRRRSKSRRCLRHIFRRGRAAARDLRAVVEKRRFGPLLCRRRRCAH
jgi:hypothetical protein